MATNPSLDTYQLISWATNKLGVTVPYMRMYRARVKALDQLGGNPEEGYKLMPRYVHRLRRTNPGSTLEL